MANARRKKKFIHSLQTDQGLATSQAKKHSAIYNHFLQHTGTYMPRQCSLNFHELGWQPRPLMHLDLPFTEEEIRTVIKEATKEKAPGSDGFISLFFNACWDTTKEDVLMAISQFYM
jgi:hypothetical protein